jgi:outer membrane protein TolC
MIAQMTSAQIITLDSVLSAIDKQHPMLREYDNRVKAMDAYVDGSKSWMAPMVGAGTAFYPYPGQTIMDERSKGMYVFSIEQDIPNPRKLDVKKNYFLSRSSVEKDGRDFQFNQLRSDAKSNYYQLIVLEKKSNVLEENKKIISLMLELARIRYPYNQGTLGNIYKAEARLHEIENMILMNEGEKEEKESILKALMQLPPDVSIAIDTTIEISFDVNQFSLDTSRLANRSDLKQINKSIEVMHYNQMFQQSQSKPDFRIRYEHMQPRGNMPVQFTLMAMISIPIAPWSSRMYKSEIAGMDYEIAAMNQRKEAILSETTGMLQGMSAQLSRMQQQLNNYSVKIIPALKKNYETLFLAYEENKEQLPMVIDAWEALNMAQLEFMDKLNDYYKMIVSYEKEIEK